LVGIYRPNFKTRFLIERKTKSPATNCTIELFADGKLKFSNMARWLAGPDTNPDHESIDSKIGSWNLKESNGRWSLMWHQRMVLHDGNVLSWLPLVGEKPPYSIQINNWQTGVPFYFVQAKD